jgi:hypothetical protein
VGVFQFNRRDAPRQGVYNNTLNSKEDAMGEKKKNIQTKWGIKEFIALIVILFLCTFFYAPLCVFSVAMLLPSYYQENDVILTCEYLHLSSDSEFCRYPARKVNNDLEAALLNDYPIGQTSIGDLVDQWDVEFKFNTESCNASEWEVVDTDTCPLRNDCMYTCRATSPVEYVYIVIDSQGMVTRYSVPNSD